MKEKIQTILFVLLLALCITPSLVFANDNYTIQLDEHLPVTVQPGDTISISFDLRNDKNYTWEDCVIILEDSYSLEISGCEGGATYSNTGTKCYVQFKGLPVGSILIRNCSDEEVQTGTVWFSESVPVESFSIGSWATTDEVMWMSQVVGGDTYIGDYSPEASSDYWIDYLVTPANHQDCYITEWTSSNENVATIVGGRIKKLQPGTTTISATLSNGMVATYDFVIIEPEQLFAGYEKSITINPGERCDFLFDVDAPGQYIVYYSNLPSDVVFTYPSEFDYAWELRGGYDMYFFELTQQDSPFYCSFESPIFIEDGELIEAEPCTITIYFEKAVPIESISLDRNSTKHNAIRWIGNSAWFNVETLPFLSTHEEIIYSSSDESVVTISEYSNSFLYCDCLASGTATITAATASGVIATREIQVTKPFVSGDDFQWTQYDANNLGIEISSSIEDSFSIDIDDHWVSPQNYTVSPGSTTYRIIVSIHSGYLQSLGLGTHEMRVYGSGGQATTTITILESTLSNPFTDVPTDSFYYDPVLWAIENGITNGLTADTFGPDATCNRAQVVTFLWRAAGCPEPTTTDNPFVDVQAGSFYEKPVLWAVEKGITNGSDATHFNPNGVCNRAQVVTFLYRAFESPAVQNTANPFTDVPAGDWYTAPVLWAVENGITNGLSATEFGPNTSCNRAQVVTFLYRAYTD